MLSIQPRKGGSPAENYHQANPESEEETPDPTIPVNPKILYHFLKIDEDDIVVENLESDRPISIGKSAATESLSSHTVLEVLTTLRQGYGKQQFNIFLASFSLVSTNAKPLEIPKPYEMLVLYKDEIENYKTNHPKTHSQSYVDQCNDHIDTLLAFLDQDIGEEVQAGRVLHSKIPPMATYENLWMLF